MKKALSVILSLIFVFLIVSCSSNGSKEETTTAGTTEQTTQAETTTQFVEYVDEEGRLVVANAKSLMEKLDMGIRVTNAASNAKYYVVDENVGMITFDFENKSYVFKGSKEVKDFSLLSGVSGSVSNFYLIEVQNEALKGYFTVNQYGDGDNVTSTVVSWKSYEGTEHEAWYVIVCMKAVSENEVNALLTRVIGI